LAPIDPLIAEGHSERSEGTGFSFGPVPSIASDTDWEYRTGFWAIEGISGENKKENLRFYFSLETPIESWLVQNATQIEGDYVVFQLGYDQICILHPQTKKIAMIARGKGPIVAKPKMGNK
jgi:hypothetical protein